MLNVGLVGGGVIGKRHLLASRSVPSLNVVAIADPACQEFHIDSEHAPLALYSSTEAMLSSAELDAVIVATPTEHHLKPTLQSLNAGKHVLVEKPIMASLEECAETIRCAKACNKHVLVAHQRRYYGFVETARQLIDSGEIGKLVSVNGQWTMRKPTDYYQSDWRKKWQAGPILTNLIHDMDMLRYIAGDIQSLTAETTNSVLQYEKEDAAAIILRFENGALGTFMLSDQSHTPWSWEHGFGENAAFPASGQNSIKFMGTKGALDFPNLTLWKSNSGESCWTNEIVQSPIAIQHEDAYIEQLLHFTDVINGDATPRVSAVDATATLRATLAVYESAAKGCRINLT